MLMVDPRTQCFDIGAVSVTYTGHGVLWPHASGSDNATKGLHACQVASMGS
jgi:hypothetical protein